MIIFYTSYIEVKELNLENNEEKEIKSEIGKKNFFQKYKKPIAIASIFTGGTPLLIFFKRKKNIKTSENPKDEFEKLKKKPEIEENIINEIFPENLEIKNIEKNDEIKEVKEKPEKKYISYLLIKEKLNELKKFNNFKYVLNLRFGAEIDPNEIAVYQIGDLDGSFAREVLAGILADFIDITEEGFNSLFTLLEKECLPRVYSQWQANDEIFKLIENVCKNIKIKKSRHKLIFVGDCIFDRLSNHIKALIELQKKLSEQGVIHIRGNHDFICVAYGGDDDDEAPNFQPNSQFAGFIPKDKRPDEIWLMNQIDEIYVNSYYDEKTKMFYTHNGFCSFEYYKNILINFKKNTKKFGSLFEEEKKLFEEKLVEIQNIKEEDKKIVTAFGVFDFEINNPKALEQQINSIKDYILKTEDGEEYLEYFTEFQKENLFFPGKFSVIGQNTNFRIDMQFNPFKEMSVFLVHGHNAEISDFVKEILLDESKQKLSYLQEVSKVSNVIAINSKEKKNNNTITSIMSINMFTYKE